MLLVVGVAACSGADIPYSNGDICRGVIASYMGRDVTIVSADEARGEIADVSYIHDGAKWKWRCHVDLPVVRIASYREGGELGRWRDRPGDDEIAVDWGRAGLKVVIRHADGSETRKVVPLGK